MPPLKPRAPSTTRTLVGLAVLLAAAVRAPFWRTALATGIDGDTAIVGLMARHLGVGTTLWGQPYGSPLDAWVAAPFVALLGPTRLAVRLPDFLLGLALVPLAAALARRVHPDAAPMAAVLMACPAAYTLLLSALAPPLYPTTLVLIGFILITAIDAADALARAERATGRLVAWGALSGLALWTHLMSASVVAATAALLVVRTRHRAALLVGALVLAAASAPLWVRAVADPSGLAVLGTAHPGHDAFEHARVVAGRLHEPVLGLLGTHTPLTADAPEVRIATPLVASVVIVVLALAGLAAAVWLRGGSPSWALLAVAALVVAAFPFPVRSDPHTVRFLTPALLPLVALVASGWTALVGPRRAWAPVVALAIAQGAGGLALYRAWSAFPPPLVPDCTAAREVLATRGVARAFASYDTAYCLTYLSGETIVASQPWNERFYGHPLPFLDEVRFARDVAWVLVPGGDFDLPAPLTFEAKLAGIGARYQRVVAHGAVVYFRFEAPFAPAVATGLVAGPAGDGDVTTRVVEPPRGPASFALTAATPAAALTLLAGPAGELPASFDLEVSSDGSSFERVGRRRRNRETVDLAWANGHPEFAVDGSMLTVGLDDRTVGVVRIVPLDQTEPWPVAEVLVHPEGARVTGAEDDAAGNGSWAERRRRLRDSPRRDDVRWYARLLLALRHR